MDSNPLIISVDFDHTIVDIRKWPEIKGLRKGARKYINKLYNEGHYIIINTCRTDNYSKECYHATEAIGFLYNQGIYYNSFNNNHPAVNKFFDADSRKISADIYVDDKGLWIFGIPSWFCLYWLIKWREFRINNRLLNWAT